MAGAAGLLAIGSAHAQTAAQGGTVFRRACALCHSIQPGMRGIGPNLRGVVGRKAGAVPGFAYTPAMRGAGAWTPERLKAFLANPRAVVPGTRMSYAGMAKPDERAAIVAFLKAN